MPDVVMHCFIFFIPFKETVFLQKSGVFAEDVNAVMDLNVSDIIVFIFTILYHNNVINFILMLKYIVLYIILET